MTRAAVLLEELLLVPVYMPTGRNWKARLLWRTDR
jgi:hypothetical protein